METKEMLNELLKLEYCSGGMNITNILFTAHDNSELFD